MKRSLSVLLAAALTCSLLGGCGKKAVEEPTAPLKIFDANDQQLVSFDSLEEMQQDLRCAYWEVAVTEAVQLLAKQTGASPEDAQHDLLTGGYALYTNFDPVVYSALESAYQDQGNGLDTGIAITDLQGNLLAVYSGNSVSSSNHALQKTAPYSSLKPLSVYMQALEKGIIHWTSTYEDSPYTVLTNEDGTQTDWPANSTNTYSMKNAGISQAVRESLNTVAVKCLSDVGVEESMAFLQEKLGIDLTREVSAAREGGEDEVIGNIALGYLNAGVTPIDMAGYYQMFANGGKYDAPEAVRQLCGPDGTVLYQRTYDPEQIISPTTAQLMNRLLQQVVRSGTGREAACNGIQIAGKTGTGDDNGGNWFVGITPGYSCAVWHGLAAENQADRIFSAVMERIYSTQPSANRNFITHANLQQIVCCTESGLAFGPKCTSIEEGYFAYDETVPVCQMHE